jgi:hypothetical protein
MNEDIHWLLPAWSGSYETTVTDATTGASREVIATIQLDFTFDRSECAFTRIYPISSLDTTRETYYVHLNELNKSFILNGGLEDSRVVYSGQVTSNGRMTLMWHEGETDELMKMELVVL